MGGNRDSYSLKDADFRSVFICFLKLHGAALELKEAMVLFPIKSGSAIIFLLNLRFVAPNLQNGKDSIDSLVEKSVRNR